jgi:uncharacterized protein YkwD
MHRRALIGGLASAGLVATSVRAAAAEPWLAYEQRLQMRAGDAAGGRIDASFERDLLNLTASFRVEQGLQPLGEDEELTRCARAHAADMAARRFFSHDTEEGFSPIDRSGLLVRRMIGVFGENLASHTGAVNLVTPRITLQGWQNSPGHRANLLRADYTHVGHGAVRIGQLWSIAAVYGGRMASLGQSLPLRSDGPAINQALLPAGLAAYFATDPHGEPSGDPYPTPGLGPRLTPGAWRLRPLKVRGGRAFNVLWGPIVVV